MGEYAIAHLNDIEEGTDGNTRWRPVRHDFGIMGFGVSAWTGRAAGDPVIKEHEEPPEELYLVHPGARRVRGRRRARGCAGRHLGLR
jgi:hypothetical protein